MEFMVMEKVQDYLAMIFLKSSFSIILIAPKSATANQGIHMKILECHFATAITSMNTSQSLDFVATLHITAACRTPPLQKFVACY